MAGGESRLAELQELVASIGSSWSAQSEESRRSACRAALCPEQTQDDSRMSLADPLDNPRMHPSERKSCISWVPEMGTKIDSQNCAAGVTYTVQVQDKMM